MTTKENEYIDFINQINIKNEKRYGIIAILLGLASFILEFEWCSALLFAIRNNKISFFGNFGDK